MYRGVTGRGVAKAVRRALGVSWYGDVWLTLGEIPEMDPNTLGGLLKSGTPGPAGGATSKFCPRE